jgi:hypothetical protein
VEHIWNTKVRFCTDQEPQSAESVKWYISRFKKSPQEAEVKRIRFSICPGIRPSYRVVDWQKNGFTAMKHFRSASVEATIALHPERLH